MGRRGGVALLAVGVLLTAGCGGADDETEPVAASTPAPAATPTVSAERLQAQRAAEEEAAILDVYYRYWDAVVAVHAGTVDPAVFEGVATGEAVESSLAIGRSYQELGIVQQGAPTFSQVEVDVDGETATVWACVDNTTWPVPGADTTGFDLVIPGGYRLERTDGAWLVVGGSQTEPTFTC